MALPKFIVLKSKYNNKYLRYVQEDSQVHSFFQFSEKNVVSPFTKLEVVPSKQQGMVHLKCCYNNRYLVRWSPHHWWLVGAADKPEEDQSKWSCTLFKPSSVDKNPQEFRFFHVNLGHYACLWRLAPPFGDCLFAGSASIDGDSCDVCISINVESLFILPKYVGFKLIDDNGKYLRAHKIEGIPHLQFEANDISNPTTWHEASFTIDGRIILKSNHFEKLWKFSSGSWILTNGDDTQIEQTLFSPIKVDKDLVAFLYMGNNNYCKRFTDGAKLSCLRAVDTSITQYSRIQVKELVVFRKISNIKFHTRDARIYDQKLVTLAIGVTANNNNEQTDVEVKFSYKDDKRSSWNSTISMKLDVPTIIESPFSFLLNETTFETKGEFMGTYEWGTTKESVREIDVAYRVDTVQGRNKVIVTLLAIRASADIPFSYTQHETLMNGKEVTYNMDDGLYSCTNNFNFKYENRVEKV